MYRSMFYNLYMDKAKIIELIDGLPEEQQAEVIDFAKFLKYQSAKARILSSDKEGRIAFDSTDDLLNAIDNAN